MSELDLPYDWYPRDAQVDAMNAWLYENCLINDWVWHRRFGKDDCALHGTAVKAHQRIGNYWHMLPQQNQVRKAIWEAVNPRTGIRRIDEAFPDSICEKRESDMFIRFRCGSTWQCLGSDNYAGAIGSMPCGIVYSEWALSDPNSYGYLSPILKDNGGWVVRQGTPRGKNHAYRTYKASLKNPNAFAQLLTVEDSGAAKWLDLPAIKQELIDIHGDELGLALFNQEYYCSFDAAVVGAVYGAELSRVERDKRITDCPHDPEYPVFTAWDIGRTDATAIWFYQVIGNEVRLIDYEEDNLKNPDFFATKVLGKEVTINIEDGEVKVRFESSDPAIQKAAKQTKHRRKYTYAQHYLPHDARAKTFAAMGKSVQELMAKVFGWELVGITPNLSVMDGIQATRKMLAKSVFDWKCDKGFETLKQYRYEQDEAKNMLKDKPLHDWTSHAADALRYVAINYETETPEPLPEDKFKPLNAMDNGIPMEEMFEL